jgi:hypothetical protein
MNTQLTPPLGVTVAMPAQLLHVKNSGVAGGRNQELANPIVTMNETTTSQ